MSLPHVSIKLMCESVKSMKNRSNFRFQMLRKEDANWPRSAKNTENDIITEKEGIINEQ